MSLTTKRRIQRKHSGGSNSLANVANPPVFYYALALPKTMALQLLCIFMPLTSFRIVHQGSSQLESKRIYSPTYLSKPLFLFNSILYFFIQFILLTHLYLLSFFSWLFFLFLLLTNKNLILSFCVMKIDKDYNRKNT